MSKTKKAEAPTSSRFSDVSHLEAQVAAEAELPRLDPATGEARPIVSDAAAAITAELAARSRAAVNGAQTREMLLRHTGGIPVRR